MAGVYVMPCTNDRFRFGLATYDLAGNAATSGFVNAQGRCGADLGLKSVVRVSPHKIPRMKPKTGFRS
ncbi:hypothetical protein HMPREF0576_1309 [Mobiluncus holmesii ATCC 35242]|uniref:Uncharacterized protein n=1 Tax=Mobiluncus holmesii ATCC 35242 TaxID=887899 RepID=E6M4R9_9ACTO|nr:hypothetical protein HMPREF0576_1309 [Mobiluncus holmesii ATCC 35242]